MGFGPFKKHQDVAITDSCFLEITWAQGQSPDDLPPLKEVIEIVDESLADRDVPPLSKTLPYLSFLQAEALFMTIKEDWSTFQLKQLSVCRKEGKDITTEGEVFASPFVIDRSYQNVLKPLMAAILEDASFSSYSYNDKLEYFTQDIFPAYQRSLGISSSELPRFPKADEHQESGQPVSSVLQSAQSSSASPTSKKSKWITGGLMAIASAALALSIVSMMSLQTKTKQLDYLHDQVTTLEDLQKQEDKIDVFIRYLLPNLYSDNKDNLVDFLDNGNSKYTKVEAGTLQSVMRESVTKSDESYQATYIIVVRTDDQIQNKRIQLNLKPDKKAKYGFRLTEEPAISDR